MPAAVVMAALLAPLACAAAQRPNILWIVSEDNSPQLGCYGDPYARTPNLDQLAREGVRFSNAFVTYSVCSPSRASFLTGLYPQQNGHVGLATHSYSFYRPDMPNVVTLLNAAGYRTGIEGKLHVNPEEAFPADYRTPQQSGKSVRAQNAGHVRQAAEFLRDKDPRPWFLSVNFRDAHPSRWFSKHPEDEPKHPRSLEDLRPLPWVLADTERIRRATATYYDGLDRLDEAVGDLLAELEATGQADNTLVIYISDHGAQFPRGKTSIYEGGLRIPMILRWPGHAPPGLVRDELVSTVDMLPTTLRAVGVAAPANLLGRQLQPLLRHGPPAEWREYIFAFNTGASPRATFVQESVRDRRWKLIWNPEQPRPAAHAGMYLDEDEAGFAACGLLASERAALPPLLKEVFDRYENPPLYELYDLLNDPHEMRNLAEDPKHAAERARLVAALQSMQERMLDPFADPRNLDAFIREQIAGRKWTHARENGSIARNYPADFRWSHVDQFREWRESRMK